MTPAQHWFAEADLEHPHHWNQSVLLDVRRPLDPGTLERALAAVVARHDSLTAQFDPDARRWTTAAPQTGGATTAFQHFLLAADSPQAQHHADELQASLDPVSGPVLACALFEGAAESPALLLAAHHLVIDAVSWNTLLADLFSAYAQIESGQPVQLASSGTSFAQWARLLERHARSQAVHAERDHWLSAAERAITDLPPDHPHAAGPGVIGDARTESLWVPQSQSDTLLRQEFPDGSRLRPDAPILAAVVQSLSEWLGTGALALDTESHGRSDPSGEADVSSTIGWFTAIYPVAFDLDSAERGRTMADLVEYVHDRLSAVPHGGVGYGLLRYLSGDAELERRLRERQSAVAFNYLGQFGRVVAGNLPLTVAERTLGTERNLANRRHWELEVTAIVHDARLRIDWTYPRAAYEDATIRRLAVRTGELLSDIAEELAASGLRRYRASAFPESGLSQDQLDDLLSGLGRPGGGQHA